MNTLPSAFLFDLNGTMIDDMHYHTHAWHEIINKDLGKNISWEDVKPEMYGKNNEVLDRIFGKSYFPIERANEISIEKEKRYQKAYLPKLELIQGLDDFLVKAQENSIKMAIGSAAIPFNIDFVLDNLDIRSFFKAIVSADDVAFSKPHPETFIKAAELLGVKPGDCIVFEDAPKGVEAAKNAGMKCIVLTTAHGKEDFKQYENIMHFIDDYKDPSLNTFFKLQNV